MKSYANGEEKTKLTYLSAMSKLLQNIIGLNLLSKEEVTEFKHALTRNEKALKMVLERLGEKQSDAIGRMVRDNDIAMVPRVKNSNTPRTILIDDERLRSILEIEINDHCFGCTEKYFLECIIYELNDDLEVCSNYQEPTGMCPYAYMVAEEKKYRQNYGSIIKNRENRHGEV